ncbi:hypothetical protein BLNAU_13865 [Blattamonas nauphoetae]|uniref:Uncharacterized protein n=1 Tax=Blattamonas nauphoetae TaxID=2049346 RepID=A0ABQ9XK98_9EUKA|nr:hypothetical protein BLNAU_13865 [Blattamonas nauphoetae]
MSVTLAWCTLNHPGRHLTAIVEDMRKYCTVDPFDLNIIGTRIENMKVVGADGLCVSQTNHHNSFSSFEGISTTVSELRIMNVSSLPGEVKEASSLFSQRMVGCAIWGSNNHLSGSVLRDMNGGGSFLCSNSTFDWCHTTSPERPSIVRRTSPTVVRPSSNFIGPSDQAEPGDDPDDRYTGKLYDNEARFTFTKVQVTITRCQFKNMKYTVTSSSAQIDGGSAICFNASTQTINLLSCSFSKCSVTSSSKVYGGCVYLSELSYYTHTVDACSFNDWYPSNTTNTNQYGGGLGAYYTSAPLRILNTNFTLNGHLTNKYNGGFFSSSAAYAISSTTIANCRFIGDAKTTGLVLNLNLVKLKTGAFSVTDTQILNTNSELKFTNIDFTSSSGFTRTEITNTSIVYSGASGSTSPHLFLDSKLDQCSIDARTSDVLFLFSGTSFTGQPVTTRSSIYLYSTSHTVFHNCAFTDCFIPKSQSLIFSKELPSLVVDTCSFTECSGGKSIVDVDSTYSFFYFCSFANVKGTNASVMTSKSNFANFFESCRFDLEEDPNVVDIVVPSSDITFLNDTAVIGCTSNRQMYFGPTWAEKQALTTVKEVLVEVEKSQMRVGTWPTEPEIPCFSSLSDAIAALSPSPKNTVIALSDENFTETGLLEVSQLVEIVGAGSNVSEIHSTQLTTDGFVSKSTGTLTLQSLRLVLSSPLSTVASTEDSGSLIVLNVIVEGLSEHSATLFQLATGSSGIRHSVFKNIESTESLICLSGTSSLTITNTVFLSIKRTSLTPTPYESTQCASCIEGKTSGTVKVLYCRFGACTTNGRAGAIDLKENDVTSAVEIGFCYFDQNSAGEGAPVAVRGDDVVLKSFDDSNTRLDLSTIQSFPSLQSILIDSDHTIVPPPALLQMNQTGVDDPLTWSYQYGWISNSLLQKHTLQYLLESRLRNNIETQITGAFNYSETMTPFIFQNSTVSVQFDRYAQSIITVVQHDEVFIQIQKAYLSFNQLQFVFDELTTPAFTCDRESSIKLIYTAISLAHPTLTHPYIESVGPYVYVDNFYYLQNITLVNTPFVRLIRAEKNAVMYFQQTTPLLASPLTVPFIICEGAEKFMIQLLTLNCSFVNSASFIHAKDSTLYLTGNSIQVLKSTTPGAFLLLESGTVKFSSGSYNFCSAPRGGVWHSTESSVSMNTGYYQNCQAEEGGVASVISSTLSIVSAYFISNSAKRGGAFFVDLGNNFASSVLWERSTFTSNTARDVDENGIDSGKGGAIFVKGTTTSEKPVDLKNSFLEGNIAAVGNDVFVKASVLGDAGPNLLSECGGSSLSRFPHFEIENHNLNDDELTQISNFITFPSLGISSTGKDVEACRWYNQDCLTLQYALPYLQTTCSNGSLYQRKATQRPTSMTTEPIILATIDLIYASAYSVVTSPYNLSLSAAYATVDGVVFTINDASRLTAERIRFHLTPLHQVVKVNSPEGQLAMTNCYVLSKSDSTTSISPIFSVGSSLILNTVSFNATLSSSIATLSAPLVFFSPTPSDGNELGSGSCVISDCSLTNLTFQGTTMFEIETSGPVSFLFRSIDQITTNLEQGKYVSLKGQDFKTQLKPEQWDNLFKKPTNLSLSLGEDVSMDKNGKWRNASLAYWLVSPSEEVRLGSDVNAVDHPNCGSLSYRCTTLDSAITSAGLNKLSLLTLSMSTSLSSKLQVSSSLLIKPSSPTIRGIEFDKNGSIEVADSATKLSFESIILTVAQTCVSATLFVVEEGELSFSSCQIGAKNSESTLVLPASTTTLIEVKSDGALTLTDTRLQHIKFSHTTHSKEPPK